MKYLRVLIIILILGFAALVGYSIKSYPIIKFNSEIKIYEVFQIISTIFIAVAIPFLIKKLLEDSRIIKTLLNDEIKDIATKGDFFKTKILECYNARTITNEDKQYIVYLFTQIENLLENFQRSLQNSFKEKYNSQFQDLKISYFTFEKNITGDDLMSDAFTSVDIDILNYYAAECNQFQNDIRKFIIIIQKK